MTRSTTVKSQPRDDRAEAQERNIVGKGPLWTLGPSPRRKLSVPLSQSGATTRRTVLGRWRLTTTVNTDHNITSGNRPDAETRTLLLTLTYYVNCYVLRKGSIVKGVWKGGCGA